jgi:fumarate reductase subunit C
MSEGPAYTEYRPRWHRERVSTYWWLKRRTYLAFILREVSSVFVAWSVLFLLLLVRGVSQGREGYEQFLEWARRPWVVALNVVALFFVTYHAYTWFNLAPQAMVVHLGERRVPGRWIALSNYALWVLVTGLVVWLVVR